MAAGKKSGRKSQASNDFLEPKAPVSVSATDVGTNRAFNNGAATVSFSLPGDSPAATSYTVTSSPGGYTATGSSSPLTVEGLQSAVSYTFTVVASNAVGNSPASSASSSITATTVPATPSAPTATAQGSASNDNVSWTAPANGGSAITQYYWESNDSKSGNTASTSVTVSQEAGTSQSYRVRATNANGTSEWSGYSTQITSFSFVPFGFVPFGAFGFTPFGAFGFTPFGAFGFTPWSMVGCIEADTLVQTASGTVPVKNIQIGDMISTIDIPEIPLEDVDSSDYNWRNVALENLTSLGLAETQVTNITPLEVQDVVWFNGDNTKKYSLTQPFFIKGTPYHVIKEAGALMVGEILLSINSDGSISETEITSIDSDSTLHTVYQLSCEPQDWFIAGGYLVHNK
jgi:hypothetical protein